MHLSPRILQPVTCVISSPSHSATSSLLPRSVISPLMPLSVPRHFLPIYPPLSPISSRKCHFPIHLSALMLRIVSLVIPSPLPPLTSHPLSCRGRVSPCTLPLLLAQLYPVSPLGNHLSLSVMLSTPFTLTTQLTISYISCCCPSVTHLTSPTQVTIFHEPLAAVYRSVLFPPLPQAPLYFLNAVHPTLHVLSVLDHSPSPRLHFSLSSCVHRYSTSKIYFTSRTQYTLANQSPFHHCPLHLTCNLFRNQ